MGLPAGEETVMANVRMEHDFLGALTPSERQIFYELLEKLKVRAGQIFVE